MKKLILLPVLLFIVGCKDNLSGPTPSAENTPYDAQLRTATYIRDHHCVVDQIHAPSRDWDKDTATETITNGYKAYKCPGFGEFEWIDISDDEVQP